MHLVHIISSLERGGAQAVLYDLVQGLAKKEYRQSIIYFHDGPYRERFTVAGIPIYQINGLLSPFDPLAMHRLYRLLKKINPSVIHTLLWAANWMGRIVAQKLGIPSIASLHNNYDQNGQLRNFLDRLIPFCNHAIIAVSDEVKASFYQLQKAACPLEVIRNGIDYQALRQHRSPVTRDSLHLHADHFVIGSVGRFAPVKRYPLLLDAFAHLYREYPQVRLLLIGTGPEEKNLRAYADNVGIADAVRWVINVPALAYYPLMDCFLLTSAKEGISIALLEAMNSGVACVITYATLHHPVIENMRNGIVVPANNATVISQNLVHLIANDSIRKQLAKQAQQTIENHFDSHRMIIAYDRLFRMYNLNK